MKYIFIIAALTFISCSKNKESLSSDTIAKDSAESSNEDTLLVTEPIEEDTIRGESEEYDCDDYHGLTSEWLTKFGKTNYVWRPDLDQASIAMGHDTIYISKGGCVHFGFLVELRLGNDNHTIADSAFWIEKALYLATEFDMEHYERMIKAGKIKKAENDNEKLLWFEVEDNNLEDNLNYDGIEINFEKKSKVVSLSQYYN